MAPEKKINHTDHLKKMVQIPPGSEERFRLSACENNLNGLMLDAQRFVGILEKMVEIEDQRGVMPSSAGPTTESVFNPDSFDFLVSCIEDTVDQMRDAYEYHEKLMEHAFNEYNREDMRIVLPNRTDLEKIMKEHQVKLADAAAQAGQSH